MQIYLDDRMILDTDREPDPGLSDASGLLALIAHLQAQLQAQGRVLCGLEVDRRPLQGDWVQALETLPVAQVSTVHLRSTEIRAFLSRTVAEAQTFLEHLAQDLVRLAQALRRGEDERAFQDLPQAVEGLQAYVTLLQSLVQQRALPLQETHRRAERLATTLAGCLQAWQDQDYVLLADGLLHRLAPEVQGQRSWLEEAERILAENPPGEVYP